MAKQDSNPPQVNSVFIVCMAVLAFLLELVAFSTFGLITNSVASGITQIVLWFALTTALILFWSMFMAPRAPKRLAWRFYYPVKAVFYCISAIAICQLWGAVLGLIFACVCIVVDVALYPYRELDLAQYFGGPKTQ